MKKIAPRPWKIEYQQYPEGAHICVADKEGNWIADFGKEGSVEGEKIAKFVVLIINSLHSLNRKLPALRC